MKKRSNEMKESKTYFRIVCISLLFFALAVTANDAIGGEAAKGGISVTTKPVIQAYTYRWIGRPDPFQPFIDVSAKKSQAVKKPAALKTGLPISPLQRLDLSAIKIVGIAGSDQKRKAIAEDNRKKFYTLQVGTYVGMNGGVVTEILSDRIIVEEKERVLGKIKVNLITMKLRTDDEGKP